MFLSENTAWVWKLELLFIATSTRNYKSIGVLKQAVYNLVFAYKWAKIPHTLAPGPITTIDRVISIRISIVHLGCVSCNIIQQSTTQLARIMVGWHSALTYLTVCWYRVMCVIIIITYFRYCSQLEACAIRTIHYWPYWDFLSQANKTQYLWVKTTLLNMCTFIMT